MKNYTSFYLLLLSLCLYIPANAQEKMLHGRVTDAASQKPLPFVTITNTANKKLSLKADADGNFTIPAAQSKTTYLFSYVGYKSRSIAVSPADTAIRVAMESDISGLNEVVVIGYGSQKKKDLTSAVSSVSGKELSEMPVTNINSALQARVPGVQITNGGFEPGAGTNIKIRGINSIEGGGSPIYVVDGVILSGDIREINPYDIESIDVLKDASAAAIYGSRAAAGVIIITTKKAKSGRSSIDYNGYYGVQKIYRSYDFIGAQDYIKLRRIALSDEDPDAWPLNDPKTDSVVFSFRELQSLAAGKSYDWVDAITQVAPMQSHTLSISNGIGRNKIYLSGNYLNQDGIIINSNMKRYSMKGNMESAVTDKVTMGLNTNFSHVETNGVGKGTYYSAVTQSPLRPIYDSLGRPFVELDPGSGNIVSDNPVAMARDAVNQAVDDRFLGNLFLDYKVIRNLNFRSSLGLDVYKEQKFQYLPRNTSGDGFVKGGVAKVENFGWRDWVWENTLTYDYNPSEQHSLNILGGFTYQKRRQEWNYEEASGFPTDVLTYKNIKAASRRDDINSDYWNRVINSVLGRVIYKFKDRYIFNFTARYDGSSNFGPENQHGFFPSVSGAWRLVDEPFIGYKLKSLMSDAKIRVSYGLIGNQDITYDKIYTRMDASAYPYNGNSQTSGYQLGGNAGNSILQWESQRQFNTGFDLAFFNSRVQASFDFYNKNVHNLLLNQALAPSQGFSNKMINVAALNTRGIDISLKLWPVKTNNFDWQINLNWSKYTSKITSLLPGRDSLSPTLKVGEAPNSLIVDYVFDGIYQEGDDFTLNPSGRPGDARVKDLNKDGVINDYDRAIVGRTTPKGWGGVWNYFRYKRLSMTVFTTYMYGHDVYDRAYTDYLYMGQGRNVIIKEGLNYWTPTNTNTDIPRPNAFGASLRMLRNGSSSYATEKGDFIRVRDITMAYDFSPNLLNRLKVRSLRAYVQVMEPFLFTSYRGIDPEINGSTDQKTDIYPRYRTFLVGVNLGL
ncbi:TonB-dependent receptor [Chitinophaga agrisoli]|uniref:TonB-dependent receptor n=1 Tax=Chitinophaga agrisoli TaxID=2607653 RepID=A0A5B2VY37_9BACT|nr:TonB-dependent receptor [Chitinophaga agrisoli]KAA2243232.1 TonB-dependent receptor [Chitinophaga agrisoli]